MIIKKINKANILAAVAILKTGGVIACPTDTSYGLSCLFRNKKGMAKILKIKNRVGRKFVLIAGSQAQAEIFFKLNKWQKKLAQKYWPGPLSLVVSSKFSVRVPAYKPASDLARLAGEPLISTSANLSGTGDVYSAQAVFNQFKKRKNHPDLILDGGRRKKVKPSMIVRVGEDGKIEILREGAVAIV